MENMNIPIIDVMDDDSELRELQQAFERLALIVRARRAARDYRLNGLISQALVSERVMDEHYNQLPEWARW